MTTPLLTHAQARAHLHALADQRLSPSDRAALDVHLLGCEACRAYASDLQRLETALPSGLHQFLDSVSAPANLAARVGARRAAAQPRLARGDAAVTALGVGALALMLILFAWVVQSRSSKSVEPAHAPLLTPDFTQAPLRPVPLMTFEGVGSLIGYSAAQDGEAALTVTLMWQEVTSAEGYAVSVQLENADGQVVAQSDVAFGDTGAQWNYGTYLAQAHTLTLPAGANPGGYQLRVVVYQLQTGERVPARAADGNLSDTAGLGALLWPISTSTPLPIPPDLSATPCLEGCSEATFTPAPTWTPPPFVTASEAVTGSPTPFPTFTPTPPSAVTRPPTATRLSTDTPPPVLEPTLFPLPTDTPTAFIPPSPEGTLTSPPPTEAVTPTATETPTAIPTPTP